MRAEITPIQTLFELLARTRVLLDEGRRWVADKNAVDRQGLACHPLSAKAYFFSLSGASMRADWEMGERLAEGVNSDIRATSVLTALCDQPMILQGRRGWLTVESILTGLESALGEYEQHRIECDISEELELCA